MGGRAAYQAPPEYYADQKTLAFRLPDDAALPAPAVTASGGTINAEALADGDLSTSAIDLPAAAETGGRSWIQFDFGRPVTVRGMTLSTSATAVYFQGLTIENRGGGPPTPPRRGKSPKS